VDVDNPLLGPDGAAAVYAPQKGASREQVVLLEQGLANWADKLTAATGRDLASVAGAGAAGGAGFAALAALGARGGPGVELGLDLLGFEDLLAEARLVITGEGRLDRQSLRGKAPVGVAAAARRQGVRVVALVGRLEIGHQEACAAGF